MTASPDLSASPVLAAAEQALFDQAQRQQATGQLLDAALAYQQVLERCPRHTPSWQQLGLALAGLEQWEMALGALNTAREIAPASAECHSSLIHVQDLRADSTHAGRQWARHAWWVQHALPLQVPAVAHSNSPQPKRCLHVGYLGAHFDSVPLAAHDHRHFKVSCYATRADAASADVRDVSVLGDAELAALIRAEQVDILVDLAGHAPGNRLLVFAHRPAPLQVTLAPAGTGMLEMDALIMTAAAVPADDLRMLFAEQVLSVPEWSIAALEACYRTRWQAWCTAMTDRQAGARFNQKLQQALQAHQAGRLGEAAQAYRALLALNKNHPDVLHLLGVIYLTDEHRCFDAAGLLNARAASLMPASADFQCDLGLAYQALKQFEQAEQCFIHARELQPDSLRLRLNHINLLRECKRYAEALALYQPVLREQPDNPDVHYNVALTHWLAGELNEALAGFVECLRLNPRYEEAHHAMVSLLEGEPDHARTTQVFRDTLAAHPFAPALHSVIAYSTDFDRSLDAGGQQRERQLYYQQQIVPQQIRPLPLKVTADPGRKLRIGFIPGRFYRNASVYAYLPVLLQLDPARFEVWCYDNFPQADEFTDKIRARADGWRDITRMSDAEVAARIRDDRIDILVDLFAHAGANRLPIYAYRPAPVQVTAWGHANGTGMACMDYLFSDPVSIPPPETGLYAEHVHYLPCQLSYWLPENAPPVAPLPMEKNGYITFGCFNRMIKVSDTVLELWAHMMTLIPDSHLLLKAAELAEAPQRERVIRIFQKHGIALNRLGFYTASPWYDHLQRYADVDFALDPFPMGGGVTTLDALWMGVPVLCLRGHTLGQRITSAIMTAVGLDDWVSDSSEAYAQLAVRKAQQVDELRRLRATLRRRMAASPLANPDYYVGCVEDAFIAFWQQWCQNPAQRLPQPQAARFEVAAHAAAADQLWRDFLADPDSPAVAQRLSESMRRAGKPLLAEAFLPQP